MVYIQSTIRSKNIVQDSQISVMQGFLNLSTSFLHLEQYDAPDDNNAAMFTSLISSLSSPVLPSADRSLDRAKKS